MYVIYLALSTTLPSSVAFFLDRTSEVTMPQDRHIFQNGLLSSILPDLYIHESDCENYGDAMGMKVSINPSEYPTLLGCHPCSTYNYLVVELETTTAPGQPTPTDETSRLGCVCYTTMSS